MMMMMMMMMTKEMSFLLCVRFCNYSNSHSYSSRTLPTRPSPRSAHCSPTAFAVHTSRRDLGSERRSGYVLFGESDVDLVLAGLGGEVGRRAGTVSAVDARQLSLGRSLDRHRETTYVYRGTFGGDKQQACRAGLWHRHCRQQ